MKFSFCKYSGSGNDFILVDDRSCTFPLDGERIKKICHRKEGIGGDGLLLLQPSSIADYKMRIFNPDGKEAKMCGNGLRCLVDYISMLEGETKVYQIEVGNIYRCQKRGDKIWIEFLKAQIVQLDVDLSEDFPVLHHFDTGVPHALLEITDLENCPILEIGKKIRYHPYFGEEGTNVDFFYRSPSNKCFLRTYERGVEGETLACGTGATAAALFAFEKYNQENPISIYLRSGETLEFFIETLNKTGKKKVEMLGSVEKIFEGSFHF